jgi:hypothetical protein
MLEGGGRGQNNGFHTRVSSLNFPYFSPFAPFWPVLVNIRPTKKVNKVEYPFFASRMPYSASGLLDGPDPLATSRKRLGGPFTALEFASQASAVSVKNAISAGSSSPARASSRSYRSGSRVGFFMLRWCGWVGFCVRIDKPHVPVLPAPLKRPNSKASGFQGGNGRRQVASFEFGHGFGVVVVGVTDRHRKPNARSMVLSNRARRRSGGAVKPGHDSTVMMKDGGFIGGVGSVSKNFFDPGGVFWRSWQTPFAGIIIGFWALCRVSWRFLCWRAV